MRQSKAAKTWFALGISSCLGAGYVPLAPGTAGSAVALPLAWALCGPWGSVGVAIAALVATLVGIWASSVAEQHYDGHDSCHIVVDELAGQLISLTLVPCSVANLVLAFGLFRLLDSTKPFPAGWIDREVGGGLGVMLDDVVAGIYAAGLTAALHYGGVVAWVLGLVGR